MITGASEISTAIGNDSPDELVTKLTSLLSFVCPEVDTKVILLIYFYQYRSNQYILSRKGIRQVNWLMHMCIICWRIHMLPDPSPFLEVKMCKTSQPVPFCLCRSARKSSPRRRRPASYPVILPSRTAMKHTVS